MIFKDIDIKELFKLMQDHDVTEISLHDGKVVVEIKRNQTPVVGAGTDSIITQQVLSTKNSIPDENNGVGTMNGNSEEVPATPEEDLGNFHIIEAPLVGTFYRAPSPDSDPFVEIGDKVSEGDVLCIVEAMKSMNEIQSDVSGVVREICVENTGMVEFEQTLFKIEPM